MQTGQALRIVHVANFPVSLKSPNQCAVEIKISNGLIRNGHHVLNLSDRSLARAAGFGHRRLGIGAANRTLVDFCRLHQPHLLVLGHADTITAATIATIKQQNPGLRVLQWNVDPLFEPDNIARINAKIAVVDATLITTAGPALAQFCRPGNIVGFMPNPADPSIEHGRADQTPAPEFDLFYACGNPSEPKRIVCGQSWDMRDFIAGLSQHLPGLRMATPGIAGQKHLFGGRYQAVLETAAIGLNISRRGDSYLYSSDRLAHIAGNGLLPAIERATGYDAFFSDQEMLFFSSFDELVAGIARNLANPALRMAAAAAARAKYFALFNECRVAAYLVAAAFGQAQPQDYPWPSIIQPA